MTDELPPAEVGTVLTGKARERAIERFMQWFERPDTPEADFTDAPIARFVEERKCRNSRS